MAAFTTRTFGDIVAAVREEAKISSADTTSINRIKRDVNAIYSEVISYKRWWWLVDSMTVNVPAFYGTGVTARVINGSSLVKLSQVLEVNKEGQFFSVEGDSEIYTVESHTPGTDELRLSQTYNGATSFTVGFKIWSDHIPLPTNCKETVEVLSPFTREPLENLGLQEYRRLSSGLPKRQGSPEAYYTGDFLEPFPTTAVTLPTLRHHTSQGVVKTLVFNGALPTSMAANVMIKVRGASHPSFNGEVNIARIATTFVANDTLIYTGKEEYTETTTPDSGLSIRLINTTANRSRYRAMYVYPCVTPTNLTHYLDYQKSVPPLELDSDEPLIPLDDRMVLVYGVLRRTWVKERNPEAAADNDGAYKLKLALMAGQMQDSLDKPLLKPSRIYLGAKRSSFRSRRFNLNLDGFTGTSGGSSGGSTVATLGTPNTVAIFNASGVLEGSSVISVAELNYLDNASSNIQTQLDTINATLASAFVVNATVSASAAIARSKLASGTNNAVVINNGSGVMTDSSVTSTELSFLSGVTPLTTVTIPNNQAVAAPVLTIPQANTFCFILYSITRGLTNFEGGYMVLLNDANVTADLIVESGAILTTGISLTADISAGNVRVLATSTNTGFTAQLKYAVIKWAA